MSFWFSLFFFIYLLDRSDPEKLIPEESDFSFVVFVEGVRVLLKVSENCIIGVE